MGRLTAEDGRRTTEDGQRRVGRKEAQKAQESYGGRTADDRGQTTEGFEQEETERTEGGGQMTDGQRRVGRKEAQDAQESVG